MKILFLGAAHEVTGSCTLLQACGKNILIDCGAAFGGRLACLRLDDFREFYV